MFDEKVKKVLEAIKVLKENQPSTLETTENIGEVIQYKHDAEYNIFSIVTGFVINEKKVTATFTDVIVKDGNIHFNGNFYGSDILNGFDADTKHICSDVFAWIDSIEKSNSKKYILSKQIAEAEAKLQEMKKEVNKL